MNPVAKKKTASHKTPKSRTAAIQVAHKRHVKKSSPALRSMPGTEEYLLYQQLKEEVGEFYPYPGLWLESPHEMLGGQTPLQVALSSPDGKETVANLIQMIKAGMFS